jgi:N-ethylmaleimide reductase
LNRIGIAYIHIGVSAPAAAETIKAMRTHYAGTLILCNGFTPETAAAELGKNVADLVALGRTFLANPDLDKRISAGALLNQPDYTTLYTPGAKGYTDYPVMNREQRTPITLPIPVYNPM